MIKQKNNLQKLQENLNIKFKKVSLLENALIHRSFLNEQNDKSIQNNERLEFLGDAVLELVVTEYLFKTFKDFSEGELTSIRSALVRTESLAEEALKLGVGAFIFMSGGEESTGGRTRPYILANTMEAIIGALYLDQGYKKSVEFIQNNVCYKASNIVENKLYIDSKSRLQEIAQEKLKVTPSYELVSAEGPDHNKTFTMKVMLNTFKMAEGTGKSKQEAEQAAALEALSQWQDIEKRFQELKNT